MMARKKSAAKMPLNRSGFVIGSIVLGLAVFIVVRNLSAPSVGTADAGSIGGPATAAGPGNRPGADGLGKTAGRSHKSTRHELRKERQREDGVSPVFAFVNAIILNEKISDAQAAVEFMEIARRTDISEAERLEALNHGLNLGFEEFGGFAKDRELPAILAQRYLDELSNLSPSEEFQISGLLDLLGHSDADISAEAAEQLAVFFDDDSLSDDPVALRHEAAKRLEVLRSQPQAP